MKMLNVYHLQLFFYVVRHRGISAAVPHIPWGIQQPALSEAMLTLEEMRGTGPLFNRKPFYLTDAGIELAEFIRPFFEGLEQLVREGALDPSKTLRIGGSQIVHTCYLGDIIELLHKVAPRFQVRLQSEPDLELFQKLLHGELDVLVAPDTQTLPSDFARAPLVTIPIVLLVADSHALRDARELWAQETIEETFIRSDGAEAVRRSFDRGLQRLGVKWRPTIYAESLLSLVQHVKQGMGIGLAVDDPSCTRVPGVRALPLPAFDPIQIGVFYRKDCSPLVKLLVATFVKRASGEAFAAVKQKPAHAASKTKKIDLGPGATRAPKP